MDNKVSANECYCGLRLVKLICDNIVERGDVPKRIWRLAEQISANVKALQLKPSSEDYEAMRALILSGFVPTFAKPPKEDVGAAIIELIQTKGTAIE